MRNVVVAATLVLALASSALAGPIQASSQGCTSDLAKGATWTQDSPTGFVFMAFWAAEAGCGETIQNPTGGFHTAEMIDGVYTVTVDPDLLPTCGRVQFDAHAYSPTGLIPISMGGLKSLVYNAGVDCTPGAGWSGRTGPPGGGGDPDDPGDPGGPGCPTCTPGGHNPVPVPEPASLVTVGLGLLAMTRLHRRAQKDCQGKRK